MPKISRTLVRNAARQNTRAIEALISALEPALRRMAKRIVPGLEEDEAVQVARIKVFRILRKVDFKRSEHAIKGLLLTAAANAMRDAMRGTARRRPINLTDLALLRGNEARIVRSSAAQNHHANLRLRAKLADGDDPHSETERENYAAEEVEDVHQQAKPSDALDRTLSPLLKEFLSYLRRFGTLSGANQAIGARHKIHPATVAKRFKEHAHRYRLRNPA